MAMAVPSASPPMRNTAVLRLRNTPAASANTLGRPSKIERNHSEGVRGGARWQAITLDGALDDFTHARGRCARHAGLRSCPGAWARSARDGRWRARVLARFRRPRRLRALISEDTRVVLQAGREAFEEVQDRLVTRIREGPEGGTSLRYGCVRCIEAALEITTSSPNSASRDYPVAAVSGGRGTSFSPTSTWTSAALDGVDGLLTAEELTGDLVRFLGVSGQGVTALVACDVMPEALSASDDTSSAESASDAKQLRETLARLEKPDRVGFRAVRRRDQRRGRQPRGRTGPAPGGR